MRRLLITAVALLLTVAPVVAQTTAPAPTPAPTATQSEEQLIRTLVAEVVAASKSDTQTANLTVIFLAVAVIGFLIVIGLFFYKGGFKPIDDARRSEQLRAEKAEAEEQSARLKSEQLQADFAADRARAHELMNSQTATLERAVNIMDGMENRKQAQEGRNNAVTAITEHESAEHEATRERISDVEGKLDTVLEMLGSVEEIDGKKSTIMLLLREIRDKLAAPTTPEPPPPTPPAPMEPTA